MKTTNTITRFKGGGGEHKVDLPSLQIADLWHIAQSQTPAINSIILDVWHLAHDLKRELIETRESNEQLLRAAKELIKFAPSPTQPRRPDKMDTGAYLVAHEDLRNVIFSVEVK